MWPLPAVIKQWECAVFTASLEQNLQIKMWGNLCFFNEIFVFWGRRGSAEQRAALSSRSKKRHNFLRCVKLNKQFFVFFYLNGAQQSDTVLPLSTPPNVHVLSSVILKGLGSDSSCPISAVLVRPDATYCCVFFVFKTEDTVNLSNDILFSTHSVFIWLTVIK